MGDKQYPKSKLYNYWIHQINPVSPYHTVTTVGWSDDKDDAIEQCRSLAKAELGKDYLLCFRVVEHRGNVIYLALVNNEEFEEWLMGEEHE